MDELDIAADIGEIKANIKNLTSAVKDGFKGLDCKENTKILTELKIDYDDRKEDKKVIKHHIIKTVISHTFKASPYVLALGGVAFALIKQ